MNRLEINPDNEKYYSKEFMQGYKCGTKSQFDADMKVLEQIRQEIEELETYYDNDYFSGNRDAMFKCNDVLQIIDKYKGEQE